MHHAQTKDLNTEDFIIDLHPEMNRTEPNNTDHFTIYMFSSNIIKPEPGHFIK